MNPTRSQKSEVTTLRSSPAGRAGAPAGVPHSGQNLNALSASNPQAEQTGIDGA